MSLLHLKLWLCKIIEVLEFQVRRQSEGTRSEGGKEEIFDGAESPNRESLGTSIEVQMGNSVELLSVQEERMVAHPRTQKKARTQVVKVKVERKCSVSRSIGNLRMNCR